MEEETHLSKSSSMSEKPLVFYKLIVDSNDYNKLRIPGKFIKSIVNELCAVAALSTPCGRRSYVGLKKEGNKLWFFEGWKEFMKTYSVCAGQFLVFRYEGNWAFSVGIFNTNEVNYLDLLGCSEKLTDSQRCQRTSKDGPADDEAVELLNQNLTCPSSESLENDVPNQCNDLKRTDNSDRAYSLSMQKFTSSSFVSGHGIKKNEADASSVKRLKEASLQVENGNKKKAHQLVRNVSSEFYRANLSNSKNSARQESTSERKSSQRVTQMSHDIGVRVSSKNDHTGSSTQFELFTPEKDGLRTLASKSITEVNDKYKSSAEHRKEENAASCEACPDKSTQSNSDTVQGKMKAIEAATMFKSNLPFCWTLLRPSDVIEKAVLNIPSAFARKHMSSCEMVTLKLCDGNHWFVHTINNSGEIRLSRGWNRFVKDNKLVEGDVCVFELTESKDDALLKVSIFRNAEDGEDVHATTNDVQVQGAEDPIQFNDSRFSMSAEEFLPHSSSEEQLGNETAKDTGQRTDLSNQMPHGNINIKGIKNTFYSSVGQSMRGRTMGAKEEKKTASTFESSNPFCQIHLQPSHLNERRGTLHIPSIFAGNYLKLKRGIIKLEIGSGKQWSVKVIKHCGSTYFSGGWIRFAKDMRLEEGDACVFELINAKDIVLKVTVFRHDVPASTSQMQSSAHSAENANGLPEPSQTTPSAKSTEKVNFHAPSTRCDVTKRTRAENALIDEQLAKRTKRANACDHSADMCQSNNGETDVVQAKEKTMHQAKLFNSDSPFCRVTMTPSYMLSKKMYIPVSFAEKYLKRASAYIKLEVSDGRQWPVKVIKSRRGIYLSRGWSQFMKDVQLLDLDVCVFELSRTDDIVLKVTVVRDVKAANESQSEEHFADTEYGWQEADQTARGFDVQVSKTRHLMSAGIDEFLQTENVEQRNETELVTNQPIDLSTYNPLCKCSKDVMMNTNTTCSDQFIEAPRVEKKGKAVRAAAMFKSSNPFCSISMRPSFVSKDARLYIPSKFAAKYMRDDCRFIKIEGSDKKQWPVKVGKSAAGTTRLGNQWSDFARVYKLEEGDVCILERIEAKLFKVTIFRDNEDVKPANLVGDRNVHVSDTVM